MAVKWLIVMYTIYVTLLYRMLKKSNCLIQVIKVMIAISLFFVLLQGHFRENTKNCSKLMF